MIALDTNVVVRVLTQDDPAQAKRAAALLRRESVWLSKTVLLETEWVLRYSYELDTAAINHALSMFVELQNLTMEDAPSVQTALAWHKAGMDFADALHLASSGRASGFATFDQKLAKKASKLEDAPAIELLEH